MNKLSRILTVCLCCIPAFSAGAAPVATTSGNNLTSFKPSNSYNNQWATMTNGRYDENPTAKADFGNCNAVILRCAQPKCGNGGCTDPTVAAQIVDGCVKSNTKCKQYGDDLVNFMTAQLVANSNAKITQQQMALEQARIQAEAQANAANMQSEQITQMQNQMAQMQQQMYQQQQESAQQLQEALAQQAAQSQNAINDMKNAATAAAKETEAGVTAYEQDAINRGVATEVLERKKITGQIMTELEDAEVSLKEIKTAMQNSFEYAGCDSRGDNCTGPKRIKKWRELATGFFDPYNNTIDKIYDAILDAQLVGVDLSNIYMMLSNSCNRWGQFLCEKGADIDYSGDKPRACPKDLLDEARSACVAKDDDDEYKKCLETHLSRRCTPCKLLKTLTSEEAILEDWIDTAATDEDNGTVVSCASNVLNNTPLFSSRIRNKTGSALVDIEFLERWLRQTEPNSARPNSGEGSRIKDAYDYCNVDVFDTVLEQAVAKKSVLNISDAPLCVTELGGTNPNSSGECTYINPIFGICDTHPYNIKESSTPTGADEIARMREIIGLKVTAVSQQMYKQYEYINATFKRLKMQLEKSMLTSTLEAAGAKSNGEDSSGSGRSSDKTIHLSGAMNCSAISDIKQQLTCISNNLNLISTFTKSQKNNACLQLQETVSAFMYIKDYIGNERVGKISNEVDKCKGYNHDGEKKCKDKDAGNMEKCINAMRTAITRANQLVALEEKSNNYRIGY